MAQFIGIIEVNRRRARLIGSKSTGLLTICNGWYKGVDVFASHVNGEDVFRVYETGGSNDRRGRLIATIR